MQSQIVCNGCRTILLHPRGAQNVRCAMCSMITPVQPTGLEMDQIICGCCHTLLMYTRGATSVRCLCCQTVNLTNMNPSPQFPETLLWGSPDQVGFSRERLRGDGHMLLYYFLSFGDYPHSIKRSFLVDELVSCIPTLPHEYKEQLHLVIFEDSKCLLHKIDSRLLKLQAPNQAATVRCGSCQMILMYPYGAPSVKCAVCHYVTNVGSSNGRTSNPVNRAHGAANSSTVPSPASAAHSQSQTVVVENPMSFDESGKLVSNVVVGVTTEKK